MAVLGLAMIACLAVTISLIKTAHYWYPLLQLRQQRREIERLKRADDASFAAQKAKFEGKRSNDDARLRIHVGNTVEISSSYRYCWFPIVHLFATGEIITTMQMSPDEEHPEGEFSAFSISRDGGHTWSRRYTLGAGANNNASYTQSTGDAIWALGNGYDALEPYPPGQSKRFHVVLSKFSRGGMEFTQRRDAVLELARPAESEAAQLFDLGRKDATRIGDNLPLVNPWGDIIEGANGDWLTTVYYKIDKDPRSTRVVLVRSNDRGKTWRETSLIAGVEHGEKPWDWMGREGPSEAAIVRLADGRLYVIFRTAGYLGHVWSSDDGKTWTRPKSTGLKGVAPRLRRLANGMLACTYGRPGPVSIMFSVDGTGGDWSEITEIFKGMSTRYTGLIEISPGRLFVVYDSVPYGWRQIPKLDKDAKNTIYGTFVEVQKENSSKQ